MRALSHDAAAHVAIRRVFEEVFVSPRPQALASRVLARAYTAVARRLAGVELATGPAEVRTSLAHLASAARRLPPHFAVCFWCTGRVTTARTHSDQGVRRCLFGCPEAQDDLRRYRRCPLIWSDLPGYLFTKMGVALGQPGLP